MKVGVVVSQPAGRLVQNLGHGRFLRGVQGGRFREKRELVAQALGGSRKQIGYRVTAHRDPSPYHTRTGMRYAICFETVPEIGISRMEDQRRNILCYLFTSNGTLTSALEPNRACAVARPTKQDSASRRSDSSSAIQSRKHNRNGTRYCEVVQ